MTRPQRHPRRPASRRPRPRSSTWKRAPSCSTPQKFELASKYLEAANRYRDQLQPTSRPTLDAYLKELAKVAGGHAGGGRPVAAASATRRPSRGRGARDGRRPGDRRCAVAASPSAPVAANPAGMPASPAETKQRGRWLLHEGREQLLRGQLRRWPSTRSTRPRRWTSSGGCSTTRRPRSSRKSRRPGPQRSPAAAAADAGQPHDRRTAKAKLREARTLLEQPPVRAGRGHRAGSQGVGAVLRPLRGQPRQGGRRGPGAAPPRQDPQHAGPRAVEPGRLRRAGAGIAPAHEGRPARRGRGQGAAGPADERRIPA